MPPSSSDEKTPTTLAEEYFAAEKREATTVYNFTEEQQEDDRRAIVVVREKASDESEEDGRPLAFVIPRVLNEQECDDLIASCEEHGISPPTASVGTLRTAKRTTKYQNATLSQHLFEKLGQEEMLQNLHDDDGMGEFYGIHSNWRVLRYDPCGDVFPAHQDQMDTMQIKREDGTKDMLASSHTMLINLSKDGVEGGATRFYPDSKVRTSALGQYDGRSVDVFLPRGWALVFRQKGLIHAGQPVTGGTQSKYVAQAGVLRLLPREKMIQPSVFRLGPGLNELTGTA